MRKRIINIVLFALCIVHCALCIAQMPQMLEDLIGTTYKAQPLPEWTDMADGERYARLDGGLVLACSYKTGQVTDTLFNISRTKEMKIESVEGFVLSPTGRHLLLYNNSQKVYRRSFTANW